MPAADRIIKDVSELRTLRKALARAGEYQTGNMSVAISFSNPERDNKVTQALNETVVWVIKNTLPTNEMRTRILARLNARVAAIEAKYPGLVD